MVGVKLTQADIYFSKCIRERADYRCERCGLNCRNMPSYLDCSHILSRVHRCIRWDKNNAVAHCKKCHKWWHSNPAVAGRWADKYLGEGFVDALYEKANAKNRHRYSKAEEKDIAKHYKDELAKLEEQRADGKQGHLDFTSYQ